MLTLPLNLSFLFILSKIKTHNHNYFHPMNLAKIIFLFFIYQNPKVESVLNCRDTIHAIIFTNDMIGRVDASGNASIYKIKYASVDAVFFGYIM